jgi:hypothetical protein
MAQLVHDHHDLRLTRQQQPHPAVALSQVGVGVDDVYVLFEGGHPRWQVGIGHGECASSSFRDELVWPHAGVAVVGGGCAVYVLDLATGALRLSLELDAYFGYLHLDPGEPDGREESLYVLSGTEVVAFDRSLTVRWRAADIAVDGILWGGITGQVLRVSAELDPPGGWRDVYLDVRTGSVVDAPSAGS